MLLTYKEIQKALVNKKFWKSLSNNQKAFIQKTVSIARLVSFLTGDPKLGEDHVVKKLGNKKYLKP